MRALEKEEVALKDEPSVTVGVPSAPVARSPQRKRRRGLSENWQKILSELAEEYTDGFGYDDLIFVADLLGHPVRRNTARSQMSLYVNEGFVEKIGDNKFKITPAGKEAAGIKPLNEEPPDDPTSSGSSNKSAEAIGSSKSLASAPLKRDLLTGTAFPALSAATRVRR